MNLAAIFSTWISLSFIALAGSLFVLSPEASSNPDQSADTDKVDWKLFFNQLFSLEIRKEMDGQGYPASIQEDIIREHIGYTPHNFNTSIRTVLEAETSAEAFRKRSEIFSSDAHFEKVKNFSPASSIPAYLRDRPVIAGFLKIIEKHRDRIIPWNENFFLSPEGKNMVDALTRKGQEEVMMIMIPGYAAHTIKFEIFPEMIADINNFLGRPESRPLQNEGSGFDLQFEPPEVFYGRTKSSSPSFDILHPAGMELGNTVGYNADTANLMAKWIQNLPGSYARKKIILLGYSKGAPTILEMLQKHPSLKSRIIGIITFCGVVQGTNIARHAQSLFGDIMGTRTIGDLIRRIRKVGSRESLTKIAPFISPFDLGFTKVERIQKTLAIFGMDTSNISEQVDRIINGREVRELLDGIEDLSPYTRTSWNFKYFNDQLFEKNTFIFNSSAITDISSFASKRVSRAQKRRDYALIAPKLDQDGKIQWSNLSLDAIFLYLTSVGGFELAPGGLYDTQVDLQNTKTPWLDESPLTTTLSEDEIRKLWGDSEIRKKLQEYGITSYETFKNRPRNELITAKHLKNLKPYDLGEFKGHHWSLFLQAFRPPKDFSEKHYIWDFPRKAYMRALLQTMALYRIVSQE